MVDLSSPETLAAVGSLMVSGWVALGKLMLHRFERLESRLDDIAEHVQAQAVGAARLESVCAARHGGPPPTLPGIAPPPPPLRRIHP